MGAESSLFRQGPQAPLKSCPRTQDFDLRGRYARKLFGRKIMANITRYDPFGDLVDDFFRGFVVRPLGFEGEVPVRRMKVDVAEQNGDYKVVAELPGVKKEDIKVNID